MCNQYVGKNNRRGGKPVIFLKTQVWKDRHNLSSAIAVAEDYWCKDTVLSTFKKNKNAFFKKVVAELILYLLQSSAIGRCRKSLMERYAKTKNEFNLLQVAVADHYRIFCNFCNPYIIRVANCRGSEVCEKKVNNFCKNI